MPSASYHSLRLKPNSGYKYDDLGNPTWRYDALQNGSGGAPKWSQHYQYDRRSQLEVSPTIIPIEVPIIKFNPATGELKITGKEIHPITVPSNVPSMNYFAWVGRVPGKDCKETCNMYAEAEVAHPTNRFPYDTACCTFTGETRTLPSDPAEPSQPAPAPAPSTPTPPGKPQEKQEKAWKIPAEPKKGWNTQNIGECYSGCVELNDKEQYCGSCCEACYKIHLKLLEGISKPFKDNNKAS